MKRASILLALVALVAGSSAALAVPAVPMVIVVLRDSVADPAAVAAEHAGSAGADVRFIYRHALKGYAARISPSGVRALAGDARVVSVTPDTPVRATTTQGGATWGIDRSDQRALPLSGTYTYNQTGAGVTAYVLDSGIRTTHNDFGGRAVWGADFIDGTRNDCDGHGTHVAGSIGGSTYGIAKSVTLIAVRVLDCTGSGSNSEVIAGVDWVTGHHTNGPAVANMSLGGGANTPLDNAVRNSINDGITYVIAAGNGDLLGNPYDACEDSPGRVAEAITIGATQSNDRKASFSNYGSCVDFFAPGVSITSTSNASNTSTTSMSGTSMAAPHVAGAAALYLQAVPSASPSAVRAALYNATTKSIVTQSSTANNHLLYVEPAPVMTLSRTSIAFGEQRTATTSGPQAVTLTNAGTGAFTISSATLTGAHASDFAKTADTCSGTSLGAGASCQIATAFSPSATGARSASLSIASGAAGSPHAVALSGTGIAPAISLQPGSVAFGNQGVGTTSTVRVVNVHNTGSAPLALGTASMSGTHAADFAIANDPCSGTTVAVGASCALSLTFTPPTTGARAATLSVPSDAGATATAALGGTGVTPTPGITVSPASVAFGDRPVGTTSAASQVTITSSGTAPLNLGAVGVSGAFGISSDTCTGASLSPGAICKVGVTFAPGVQGAHAGQITLPTNAPTGTASVALSGNGTPPAPEVHLSPSSVSFAARPVGSTSPAQQIVVTNIGSEDLAIGLLGVSGPADFARSADTCTGATLAVGQTCSVSVTFTPATFGPRSATVIIPSNATLGPDRFGVSGIGIGASAEVTPTAISFDDVFVGSVGPTSEVRVRNVGNATLTLGPTQGLGAHAGDFRRSADACGNAAVAPGASCTLQVAFAPTVVGARSASISLTTNAGAPVTVALSGTAIGDATPPVSTWTTPNLDVKLGSLSVVSGQVTDNLSGVERVSVTFAPAVGASSTVTATLGCATATSCGFTANVPLLPGVYRVTAVARDLAGNVESPGAQIQIIVV